MIIIDYNQKQHKQIMHAIKLALDNGKVVAYPTDTSYGLAADVTNVMALKKLYKIKERSYKQPIHMVIRSITDAKKYVRWNKFAEKIAKAFWPGPLTIVLPLKTNLPTLSLMSAGTGTMGLRMPNQYIAQDIVKVLKRPITATSANPSAHLSNGYDSYAGEDVIEQFSKQQHKPDIVINSGVLPKRKPSTMVAINADGTYSIIRKGPISKIQIKKVLQK